jgi:hypothetical protein
MNPSPLRRRLAALVVAGASLLVAATALAVPARQGTVSVAAPVYTWDGGPGNGSGQGVAAARCTPGVYECEDTLVEVKDPGDLYAEVKAGANATDLDIAIYKSDASGTTAGDPVNGDKPDAEDTSTGKDAKTTLKKVTPGFYVVRVRIFDGIQAVWKGTAILKTPPPPVSAQPAPAPTATPAPAAAPPAKPSAKERRNACKKKAKKIKNAKKRKKALKKCNKIK